MRQLQKDFIPVTFAQLSDLNRVMSDEMLSRGHAAQCLLGGAQEVPQIKV